MGCFSAKFWTTSFQWSIRKQTMENCCRFLDLSREQTSMVHRSKLNNVANFHIIIMLQKCHDYVTPVIFFLTRYNVSRRLFFWWQMKKCIGKLCWSGLIIEHTYLVFAGGILFSYIPLPPHQGAISTGNYHTCLNIASFKRIQYCTRQLQ